MAENNTGLWILLGALGLGAAALAIISKKNSQVLVKEESPQVMTLSKHPCCGRKQ